MKFKQLFVGIVIGAVIFGAVPAFASNSMIQVFFNDIGIKVNGQIINTGEDKPFIYSGRTYVPARYVAEALGAKVSWNESDNTVEINNVGQTPQANLNTQSVVSTTENTYSDNTVDGLLGCVFNGKQYIIVSSLYGKFKPLFCPSFDSITKVYSLYKDENTSGEPLIKSVPYVLINGRACITYDYYANTILPLSNQTSQ